MPDDTLSLFVILMTWTKEQRKEYMKNYYSLYSKQLKEYSKDYYQTHKDKILPKARKRSKDYRYTHKEYGKKYRETRKEHIKKWRKEYRERHRDVIKKWRKTHPENMKKISDRGHAKHRKLGCVEFNNYFKGSHGHHIDKECIVYIPKSLHRSVYHSVWSGRGMDAINDVALGWLVGSEYAVP